MQANLYALSIKKSHFMNNMLIIFFRLQIIFIFYKAMKRFVYLYRDYRQINTMLDSIHDELTVPTGYKNGFCSKIHKQIMFM